jgi:S-adenosylmethionine hydrolase
MPARVTLLTDFGTRDGYVGAVKGVISAGVPGALVDDVSHDLPRGDVSAASYALGRFWRLYPEGTVHVAVVDAGVGTSRRALALEADGRFVVAPDNGVASRVLAETTAWRAVEITRVETPSAVRSGRSSTFHARDVFAPAAVELLLGSALESLGPRVHDPVVVGEPAPVRGDREASGVVIAVDHFGNLLTNIPGAWLGRSVAHVAGRTARAVSTYGEGGPRELVALVGSDGRVELAVRDGSAARQLAVGAGAEVRIVSPAG